MLQFDPAIPPSVLIPIALVLMLWFGWSESRKPYPYKWLRVIAQTLALLSVLALLLRPSMTSTVERPSLLLLTPSYSAKQVDSLLNLERNLTLLLAPGAAEREGALRIQTYRELQAKGNLRFVLGDGIPAAFLETLGDEQFAYLPGKKPNGIMALNTGPFLQDRACFLSGTIRNGKGAVLKLVDPGGGESLTRILKMGEQDFRIEFTTKRPGLYVYDLIVLDSSGQSTKEQVPIEVMSSKRLSILMLQTYPHAEVKFLKNYLAEKGHLIVTRYQLSKNVMRYEYANGASGKFDRLTEDALNDFDLVLTDDESMERISESEAGQLRSAVRNGLGVLLLAHRAPSSARFPGSVLNLKDDPTAPDTIRYSVPGFGSNVSFFAALDVKRRDQHQSVLTAGSRVLSGFVLEGDGKVGYQTLMETYQLALSGKSSLYAALWTPLLEQMARREDITLSARSATPFPIYPDESVDVEIIGSTPTLTADGVHIPLMEDVVVDDLWHGTFWSDESGWKALKVGSKPLNVFISKPGAWLSLRKWTQQHANVLRSGLAHDQKETREKKTPISAWIFFSLFLLLAGFVWLAPKL
jgi:hypothetical protein